MNKTRAAVSRHFIQQVLLVTLVIAFIIFLISTGRNAWKNMRSAQSQSQEQIAALQSKLDTLNDDIRMVTAKSQVDMRAYTTAQVKNAYLLVSTAARSLQQDQDVEVAKQLMQLAYDNLENLPGTKITQAKSVIAADQAKLNAVAVTDKSFIQDKLDILDKLINILPAYKSPTVDVVPATVQKKTAATNTHPWYQPITNMFRDLTSIIKIRKKTAREITVTELDVARAQFKLIIEQLRWAAFYNNVEVYQGSIKNAQELLPKIFDMRSESVQKFAATLQELQQIQLRPEIPSMQNSVNALKALLVG